MLLFVEILALVLVVATWLYGDQEGRTKLVITVVYLATWGLIFVGGWAVRQLWLFWVAPILGGVAGGALYGTLFGEAIAVQPAPPVAVQPSKAMKAGA